MNKVSVNKKTFIFGIFTAVLILAIVFLIRNPKPAPDVVFKYIDGQQQAMSDLRGRPVLINFWASNCSTCREEMPDLVRLYNQYHTDGLEMIGVVIYYNAPNLAMEFLADSSLPYPIALDVDKTLTDAFINVHYTPTTFLISPEGNIVERYTGPLPLAKTEQQIQQMLNTTDLQNI